MKTKEMTRKAKKALPRKKDERAAAEVGEFAESIIDTVREPLLALDHDLRIVKANRSFYRFFKIKPEETVGQLIYDLGNKQWDIPKLRELLETVLPQKTTFDDYEVEHEFTAIGRRIMLLNAREIQRAFGKDRVILLAIEDITERKEIEAGREKTRKELAVIKKSADEASEFAESIINTVREPLISLDQDLRVVSVSRSFYEFFKVKPEETVGQLIYDLGNKQWDIPKLRELLETILPKKATFDNYEVEHDFATIGRRVMLLNARQIQRAFGKERIILLAIEDITEKMRLQRELAERTRDAEAATRAKSDFLANMSHELRTPLNSIIGFSEVLEDELLGSLNASQRENVQYILKAGRHLLSLINDILDLSKVESGKMNLEVDRVPLKEMLEAMLAMHREKALQHGIDLDLQMEPVTGMEIEADERKLKQILFNLLSNAVKFAPDGGSVRVMAREISGAQEIEISIEDSGIGIKPEDMPKLFKEFAQLDSVYDKKYDGTGLGLALTKKLVELHGGRIQVSSEFGKGSRFTFIIPVKQARRKNG
ncbi:MAG: PAS domain-containing sensor histidine kinase [Candidatus Aminicenantes bacterium]|nr:PAS domain-containing sensor histidine kinase [Candidatus Aminicenantes bacterium]